MMGWILGGLLGLAVGMIWGHKLSARTFADAMEKAGRQYDESTEEIASMWKEAILKQKDLLIGKIKEYQHRELLYIGFLCSNGHKEVAERIGKFAVEISVDD